MLISVISSIVSTSFFIIYSSIKYFSFIEIHEVLAKTPLQFLFMIKLSSVVKIPLYISLFLFTYSYFVRYISQWIKIFITFLLFFLNMILLYILIIRMSFLYTYTRNLDEIFFFMDYKYFKEAFGWIPFVDTILTLKVSFISLIFCILTVYIISVTLLICLNSIKEHFFIFLGLVFLLEFFLLLAFLANDVILFYFAFEGVVVPMYFIIGFWGSRGRKSVAAYYLFFYTFLGSLLMLLAIIEISAFQTDIELLQSSHWIPEDRQYWLWLCFFVAFSVKVPIFPFHLWLPEAHVEAPTPGSVILAGLLLKLGGYGFLTFCIGIFAQASVFFQPLVFTICFFSINFASIVALRQRDLKKIVAYSSIAHMGIAIAGLFALTIESISGAIFVMVGHGFVSSAMFFLIGVVYDRYSTRELDYYGGIVKVMPMFTSFLFFFSIANFSFPGTVNFPGELLIIVGIVEQLKSFTFFLLPSLVFGTAYTMILFTRVAFGEIQNFYHLSIKYSDINFLEFFILLMLLSPTVLLGLVPNIIISLIGEEVEFLLFNTFFKFYQNSPISPKFDDPSYVLRFAHFKYKWGN